MRSPLLALNRLLIALRTVRRARRALIRGTTTDALRALDPDPPAARLGRQPEAWARAVGRAGLVLHADCMPRSVALARLLTATGSHATLVLGTRRDGTGTWVAHAWVEVGGAPVAEDTAAFTTLASSSAATGWTVVGREKRPGSDVPPAPARSGQDGRWPPTIS